MISENTKAILLLTSNFNNKDLSECKPLTINGYGYFARWLNLNNYRPSDLLNSSSLDDIIVDWCSPTKHILVKEKINFDKIDQTISNITPSRLKQLLARGASLSLALERWSSVGIWILDRGSPLYPKQIKTALKDQAPAIFFGIGNKELLSRPSVGFVGSRNADQIDLDVTEKYVSMISQLELQVVSGAARGIDTHAMLTCLKNGDSSIGILSDSLMKASVNRQWREYLKSHKLALITPFYPEGRFTPSNAMQRNKYIYLMSLATIVVCSTESNKSRKSGTFEGAKENLKNNWVPLLVSDHHEPNHLGNLALIEGLPKIKCKGVSINPGYSLDTLLAYISSKPENYIENALSIESSMNKQGDLLNTPVEDISVETQSSDILITNTTPVLENFKPTTSEFLVEKRNNKEDTHALKAVPEMPLLNHFYEQLTILFKEQTNNVNLECIDYVLIEERFPEFKLISKTALDKWLKYLIEQELLIRPNKQKREFCLPTSLFNSNNSYILE